MACEVAALPFHTYANYGTWSIDFDYNYKHYLVYVKFESLS